MAALRTTLSCKIFWQNATIGRTHPTNALSSVLEDAVAAERYHLPRRREQALRARVLLRAALAETYGVPAAAWRLQAGASGAPVLAVWDEIRCAVSLAHSRGVVACAVAECDAMGVDVEAVDSTRAIHEIARAAFGPTENAAVERRGSEEFYRIWTLREAYAKATRRGFAAVVDGIDLPEDSALMAQDPDRPRWRFAGWRLPCGYWLGFAGWLGSAGEIAVHERPASE
jgi:phosphopantetheinyl transferase